MDFSKLSSKKWQTKLSKKAQASVDQGANGPVKAKHKNTDEEDSLALPKKGRLTQPNGASHASNPHGSCPMPVAGSTHLVVPVTSSLGSVGDCLSPTDPSDRDTQPLMSKKDSGGNATIVVWDSGDEDSSDDDNGWIDDQESPDEELGLQSPYWDMKSLISL